MNSEIIQSKLLNTGYLAGVLQLHGNCSFGRTANKKRLLYKCTPDDKELPVFLIPYEMKMDFSKVFKNKYVLFTFDHWNETHPHGLLKETIGDVDDLNCYYEYQLYCKHLHISINDFTNKSRDILQANTTDSIISRMLNNPKYQLEDRRAEYIFSIDPENSRDFDDAFSIQRLDNNETKISVYIANVCLWLEEMELWNSFSTRVSTIYLPDKKRTMLPVALSDIVCSLLENNDRLAFVMEAIFDETGQLKDIQYKNAVIRVKKNFVYEEPKLLKNHNYKQLFEFTTALDKNMKDSHDLVEYWMIYMNSKTGEHMANHKMGIFRSVHYTHSLLPITKLDHHTQQIVRSWNNVIGKYICYSDDADIHHDMLERQYYVQITSPIRRLVDVLNMLLFIKYMGLADLSRSADAFLSKWLAQMDFINKSMKDIRKIQVASDVLHRCFHNPQIMNSEYEGVLFDKTVKGDKFKYMVYLKDIKLLTSYTSDENLENYTYRNFKIYLFENEDQSRKKIRLQLQHEKIE
jgi:exoribonuclease R